MKSAACCTVSAADLFASLLKSTVTGVELPLRVSVIVPRAPAALATVPPAVYPTALDAPVTVAAVMPPVAPPSSENPSVAMPLPVAAELRLEPAVMSL